MKVTSPAFEAHEEIPKKYTCDGEDINPLLVIEDMLLDVKYLVLIMEDPDAPTGTWDHWIVFNIPVQGQSAKIDENSVPGVQGANSWGRNEYGGPCPPTGEHRYRFKIYALDDKLDLPEGATKRQVEQALKDHFMEQGEIIGTYSKK